MSTTTSTDGFSLGLRLRPQSPLQLKSVVLMRTSTQGKPPNRHANLGCGRSLVADSRDSIAVRDAIRIAHPQVVRCEQTFTRSRCETPIACCQFTRKCHKNSEKILQCWPVARILTSSDVKCLQFGLALRFGLRCMQVRAMPNRQRCGSSDANH